MFEISYDVDLVDEEEDLVSELLEFAATVKRQSSTDVDRSKLKKSQKPEMGRRISLDKNNPLIPQVRRRASQSSDEGRSRLSRQASLMHRRMNIARKTVEVNRKSLVQLHNHAGFYNSFIEGFTQCLTADGQIELQAGSVEVMYHSKTINGLRLHGSIYWDKSMFSTHLVSPANATDSHRFSLEAESILHNYLQELIAIRTGDDAVAANKRDSLLRGKDQLGRRGSSRDRKHAEPKTYYPPIYKAMKTAFGLRKRPDLIRAAIGNHQALDATVPIKLELPRTQAATAKDEAPTLLRVDSGESDLSSLDGSSRAPDLSGLGSDPPLKRHSAESQQSLNVSRLLRRKSSVQSTGAAMLMSSQMSSQKANAANVINERPSKRRSRMVLDKTRGIAAAMKRQSLPSLSSKLESSKRKKSQVWKVRPQAQRRNSRAQYQKDSTAKAGGGLHSPAKRGSTGGLQRAAPAVRQTWQRRQTTVVGSTTGVGGNSKTTAVPTRVNRHRSLILQ